jgi:microcin C transport system substrate-binding protein
MPISRRSLLQLASAFGGLSGFKLLGINAALADDEEWRHGLSLFGDVKYPADFKHFGYVNPDAPKAGRARLYGIGSFDSLNPFTFKGSVGGLVGTTFDALMTGSLDEPSSEYGLIAEVAKHPADFSQASFRLNADARFHDGSPVTVDDVIWSMEAIKQSHPTYAFYYKNITRAEQTGDREVSFFFSETGNRELPHITGQLPVLSKAWWTGTAPDGKTRDISGTTLEPPLGSGAYKISEVKPARSITVKRVEDYWGRDLPVNVGQNNFDELTITYFRDQTVAFEAFKGDQYDWRRENTSKVWATGYDFPAVRRGDVVLQEIEVKNPQGMQCYGFNIRRDKFRDPRVRRAFNYVFDFEWSNANLFYGQYKRTRSYFDNSELAATGLPQGIELEILNGVKDQVPAEVFTTEFTNPVNNNQQDRRNNLRQAARLLREAGWKINKDRKLVNDRAEVFELEFLLYSPLFERITLPYVEQLERLGIHAKVRTVDSAQYERRVQNFDFDVIVASWGQSLSPGNEQRNYWGSESASRDGSNNYVGIADPAIDALIDKVIYAKDREHLVAATRALDRVLLWNHFVVPMWHIPVQRTARWNRFGSPEQLPLYSDGFPSIWWWDQAKADKVTSG